MWRRIGILAGALIGCVNIASPALISPAAAQTDIAPCGYVDEFEFPVPGIDVDRTDFGIYRTRFGGLHTGIDVAFGDTGDPVRAAARGRVTYSDVEGWDTEKGVVVIQHTMPDGTLVNTLYGHMEELNGYTFPPVDTCIEQGDIVGAVGDPSLSRPHLHYEIRTRYRYEGGPGYTQINPLELGWLHPVDFTYLARVMVEPAYRGHFTLTERATLPPLPLEDSTYVVAQGATLRGITSAGQVLWQFDMIDAVSALLALPDGRVLATTTANQVLVLDNGTYNALWSLPDAATSPPLLVGESIVFIVGESALLGVTPEGSVLWETPLPGAAVRWTAVGNRLAVSTASRDLVIVDPSGQILHNSAYPDAPVPVVTPDQTFLVMSGSRIEQLDGALQALPLIDTGRAVSSAGEMVRGPAGEFYVYTGEGRALYAYDREGNLLWNAYMPGSHRRAPLLGMGGGQLLYALTANGQLLTYNTADGRLAAQFTLYDGGMNGVPTARWMRVAPDDTVTFGSGFLSAVTIDGLDLLDEPPPS
jgi:murein DD-endopeptidase MepM/ murein hydrolase activator NlpD